MIVECVLRMTLDGESQMKRSEMTRTVQVGPLLFYVHMLAWRRYSVRPGVKKSMSRFSGMGI